MSDYIPPFYHFFEPSAPGVPGAFYYKGEWLIANDIGSFLECYFSDENPRDPNYLTDVIAEKEKLEETIDTLEEKISELEDEKEKCVNFFGTLQEKMQDTIDDFLIEIS